MVTATRYERRPATLPDGEPTPESEIDKVMGGAVHELGHIVVFHSVGLPMGTVAIRRRWFTRLGAEGAVWTHDPMWDNPEQVEGFLIGMMAGMEAHRLWLMTAHHWDPKRAGLFAHLGGGGDRCRFQHYAAGRMSMSTARAQARRMVAAQWPRIERGAPVLRRYREMKVRKLVKT